MYLIAINDANLRKELVRHLTGSRAPWSQGASRRFVERLRPASTHCRHAPRNWQGTEYPIGLSGSRKEGCGSADTLGGGWKMSAKPQSPRDIGSKKKPIEQNTDRSTTKRIRHPTSAAKGAGCARRDAHAGLSIW